jgi:hypothetical protein
MAGERAREWAKPIYVIHVHCERCDRCLCVTETGSSGVRLLAGTRVASLEAGRPGHADVVVAEGVCIRVSGEDCDEATEGTG